MRVEALDRISEDKLDQTSENYSLALSELEQIYLKISKDRLTTLKFALETSSLIRNT